MYSFIQQVLKVLQVEQWTDKTSCPCRDFVRTKISEIGRVLVVGDSSLTACELLKNASLSLSFHPDQTQVCADSQVVEE